VLSTKGFLNPRQLRLHYAAHGTDVGAASAGEYEALADRFLAQPKGAGTEECKRSRGDTVRFDPTTDEFGVLDAKGVIRTYFKPVPCASVPSANRSKIKQTGRCHDYSTNLLYFQEKCKRW
jgi:hypothetical protein